MNKQIYFHESEIGIFCAEHVRHGVYASLEHARELSKRGKVMYLNTSFSTRQLNMAISDCNAENDSIEIRNVEIGGLSDDLPSLRQELAEVKYLIINAWEFANDSYTRKEKVIFELMKLRNKLG